MKHIFGDDYVNILPVMTLAKDEMTFAVSGAEEPVENVPTSIVEWQRWNDYGIGLLRKGGKTKGELRQAEEAFLHVEALGRPDGPLNLARIYVAQGTVQDKAIAALQRAANYDPPAPPWSVSWFTGQVNKQNGYLDEAIENFRGIIEGNDAETRRLGFDFGQDYRLLNALGQTIYERAKQERGSARKSTRDGYLRDALAYFEQSLTLDPENTVAHYNLSLIYRQLGQGDLGKKHLELYRIYKPDDNARDRAVALARRKDPAANHAAEAVVIYDLHRDGAYEAESSVRKIQVFELKPTEGLAHNFSESKSLQGN
ncbi:MAG: tetratricopeptide repeat protein [Candidatus Latescibacteria bacterium]|nr:tetratricopeptide repeat protein [Candidatus Latescibacterota bacterium]